VAATIKDVISVINGGTLPAFSVNPAAGDCIVVFYAPYGNTVTSLTAPSDSQGNTYTQIGSTQNSAPSGLGTVPGLAVWVAKNVAAGATTVTRPAGDDNPTLSTTVVWLLTGVDPDPYNGDWIFKIDNPDPPNLGPTAATPLAGSILLVALANNRPNIWSPPTGYNTTGANGFTTGMNTAAESDRPNGAGLDVTTAYKMISAVETPIWPSGISQGTVWVGMALSFKPLQPHVAIRAVQTLQVQGAAYLTPMTAVAGDTILVAYQHYIPYLPGSAPTDDKGNTYVQVGTTKSDSQYSAVSLWMAKNVAAGSTTILAGPGNYGAASAWVVGGLDPTAPYNSDMAQAFSTISSVPSVGPTSPAPSGPSFFLVVSSAQFSSPGVAAPAGWNATGTNDFDSTKATNSVVYNGGLGYNFQTAYIIGSVAETATFVGGNQGFWSAEVGSFALAPPPPTIVSGDGVCTGVATAAGAGVPLKIGTGTSAGIAAVAAVGVASSPPATPPTILSVVGQRADSAAAQAAVTMAAGDAIVVCIGHYDGSAAVSAPTDDRGNTYVQVGPTSATSPGAVSVSLWLAANVAAGATVVTVNPQNFGSLIVWYLTGVAAAPYNGDAVATNDAGTGPDVGPSGTAPAASSLFLAVMQARGSGSLGFPSGDWNTTGVHGFTTGMATAADQSTAIASQTAAAYTIADTAQQAVWSGGAGRNWAALIASFAPGGSAPDFESGAGASAGVATVTGAGVAIKASASSSTGVGAVAAVGAIAVNTIIDVQGASGNWIDRALSAFASNPTTGDSIVVAVANYAFSGDTPGAPTDNYGNTYTKIGTTKTPLGTSSAITLWLAKNITGGAAFVVSVHNPTNYYTAAVAWCLRGVKSDPYNADFIFANDNTGLVHSPGASATPPGPSIFIGADILDGPEIPTDASGWNTTGVNGFTSTMLTSARRADYSLNYDVFTSYKISSASETPVWTISGTQRPWCSVLVSFALGGGDNSGVGNSAGIGAAAAIGVKIATAAGSATGVATVAAVAPIGGTISAAGNAAGVAVVTGAAQSIKSTVGTSVGTSTVNAVGVDALGPSAAAGMMFGIAAVGGVGESTAEAAGTLAGTSTAEGSSLAPPPTRFWFPSSGTAPLSALAFDAGWTDAVGASGPTALRRLGMRVRTNTSPVTLAAISITTDPELHAIRQYQIPNLAAQTISGTVKGQIRTYGAGFGTVALAIRVVSADGSIERGTLLAPDGSHSTSTPPRTVSAGPTNRPFADASDSSTITLTPVVVQDEDILIIEIGGRSTPFSAGNSVDFSITSQGFGDLPEDSTSTTNANPWIEFSNGVQFEPTIVSGAGSCAGTSTAFGVPDIIGGSLTQTLDALTCVATGLTVTIHGTVTSTLDPLIFTSFGDVGAHADLTATLDDMTCAASVGWPAVTPLRPQVIDDHWGGALTYQWTQISGPATATFVDSTALWTNVYVPQIDGVYVFKLQIFRELDSLVGSSLTRLRVYATPILAPPPGGGGSWLHDDGTGTGGKTGSWYPQPIDDGGIGTDFEQLPLPDAAGPVIVTANGVSAEVQLNSVNISESLGQPSTCTFKMYGHFISVGNDVVIERKFEGGTTRLFGGVCLSVQITDNEGHVFTEVSLVGYAWHLGRTMITKKYVKEKIEDIVADIATHFPGGVTAGAIEDGLGKTTVVFTDTYLDAALTQLTKLVKGLHWRVDNHKALFFGVTELGAAPDPVTPIHLTMRDLTVTHTLAQTANRVIMYYGDTLPPVSIDVTPDPPEPLPGAEFEYGGWPPRKKAQGRSIQVDSLAGYDPKGGYVLIGGNRIKYTGVSSVRTTPIFGTVQATISVKAVEGGEFGAAPHLGPFTISPSTVHGYWLSIVTPDGETPPFSIMGGMPGLRNGLVTLTQWTGSMFESDAEPTEIHESAYEITVHIPKRYAPSGGGVSAVTSFAEPKSGAHGAQTDGQVSAKTDPYLDRVSSINVYRNSGEARPQGDTNTDIFLVGNVSKAGGVIVDGQARIHLAPVTAPKWKYTLREDGSYPWDPPNTYFITGCVGVVDFIPRGTGGMAYVIAEDTAAQQDLTGRLGGAGGDYGVVEAVLHGPPNVVTVDDNDPTSSSDDTTTVTYVTTEEAYALALSYLSKAEPVATTVACTVEDPNAHAGQTLDMNMPDPYGTASLTIQQAGITGFEPYVPHRTSISSGTEQITMDDLIRKILPDEPVTTDPVYHPVVNRAGE
jgi:hypothetical protein